MKNTQQVYHAGLQELTPEETIVCRGGAIPWGVGSVFGLLAYLAKECISDWQCFKDGLRGRPCLHGVHK